MQLLGSVEALGKGDPAQLAASGFVDLDGDPVSVHSLEHGRTGQPAASERPDDEEQIIIEPISDVGDVSVIEMAERVGLGPEQVLGPEPVLGAPFVGPAHPIDPEAQPAEVERLDLAGEVRMPFHEARL